MARILLFNTSGNMHPHLKEVARLFLKLGIIGFGGPAVHIAMMEDEVVRRRGWLTHEQFLDLVGATNLIPGPNSTEMAMHIGHKRAGWKGLFVAGACFIIPAVLITAVFAVLYARYGTLPEVQPFIYGIKPAIIAVVVATIINLGRKALKSLELGIIGIIASVAVLLGMNEIFVLFGAGFLGILLHYAKRASDMMNGLLPVVFLQIDASPISGSGLKLFLLFLKVGAILYGSGYVLFGFLDAELVGRGWLTKVQLIDAIAVGQFTPGPVFSSATFIGWQIGGWQGAIGATIGIFLPSFVFVALLNPLIPKLRKSSVMSAFLDTVNVVSIAIILSVLVEMGSVVLLEWRSILICCLSFGVTLWFKKVNSAFIVFGGAAAGYALYQFA